MRFKILIQSTSDIITNSSSEVFVVKTDKTSAEIEALINEGTKGIEGCDYQEWVNMSPEEQDKYDMSSGMGGNLDVSDWMDRYKEYVSYFPKHKQHLVTPEIWNLQHQESLEEIKNTVWIDIDWHRKATIKWILENLWVYGVDSYICYEKDPETSRILRIASVEEWKQLPEERRSEYL